MAITVVVGVRVTEAEGLSFFGVGEVNAALKAGKRVTALEPDGALFQEIKGDKESILHTLSGFTMKVVMED